MSTSLNIDKLIGPSNYRAWKFAVKMLLIHEDLFEFISKEELKPEEVAKDQKALAKICLTVQPQVYPHISNATTSRQAWQNLEKVYADSALQQRIHVMRSLFNARFENYATMEEYVLEVIQLSQQLTDMNHGLDDELIAVILLSGLPQHMDPLVMTLENCGKALTTENVKTALLAEGSRRVPSAGNSSAFMTASSGSSQRSSRDITCYRCNEKGHISRFCPNKPGDKKGGKNSNAKNNSNFGSSDKTAMLTALTMSDKIDPEGWFLDSAATRHMSPQQPSVLKPDIPVVVTTAGKEKLMTQGLGNFKISLSTGEKEVQNVHIVKGLATNLLSVSQLCDKGFTTVFEKEKCYVIENSSVRGDLVATGSRDGGLYKLDTLGGQAQAAMVSKTKERPANDNKPEVSLKNQAESKTQVTWHRRLGHLNSKSMNLLKSKLAKGIAYASNTYQLCDACVKGKLNRKPFPKERGRRSREKLELIHSDVVVVNTPSFGGARYLLTFLDDFSRKIYGYFLKEKSQVKEAFEEFQALVENETGLKIKCLRTDNGSEYVNRVFQVYLKKQGIRHETSCVYTPQQNGAAERCQQTIFNRARSMLQQANLDDRFWGEAANCAIHLINRSPTHALHGVTPEALWSGKGELDLSYLRVFGCKAYSYNHWRKKLDPKAEVKVFVGYSDTTKGYRLLDPATGKIEISRDVVFFEDEFQSAPTQPISKTVPVTFMLSSDPPPVPEPEPDAESEATTDSGEDEELDADSSADLQLHPSPGEMDLSEYIPEDTSNSDSDIADDPDPHQLRSTSGKEITEYIALTAMLTDQEPLSMTAALKGRDKAKWREAMNTELACLQKNHTWDVVDLPSGKKVVGCKWVYKIKRNSEGEVDRYKARLVAKGFTQTHGIDYNETYSPVVRMTTLRLLFSLAQTRQLKVDHLDAVSAFLHGNIDEEVYMELPPGYELKSVDGAGRKVCRLRKAIYGLKQSSRAWYIRLAEELMAMGFKRLELEPCVFHLNGCFIAVFVDDLLFFCTDDNERKRVKETLMSKFEMRDLGEASHVLGMRIRRDDTKFSLDQATYICQLLEKFNMSDCATVNVPMGQEGITEDSPPLEEDVPYRELIGCLQWLSLCTRPDITFAVNRLAQHTNNPRKSHWLAAKRVLRYLKGTLNKSLVLQDHDEQLNGFVDSDWGAAPNRRSCSGFLLLLGNCPVSWDSRRQKSVALSTCEAEYMAYSDAVREALFLKGLYEALGGKVSPVLIFTDSQAAEQLATNPMVTKRSKHIDIRYHFVKEQIEDHNVVLKYLCTEEMLADIFTKPLPPPKFLYCISEMGLC